MKGCVGKYYITENDSCFRMFAIIKVVRVDEGDGLLLAVPVDSTYCRYTNYVVNGKHYPGAFISDEDIQADTPIPLNVIMRECGEFFEREYNQVIVGGG